MSNFHPRQIEDNPLEILKLGCDILRQEGNAILSFAEQLDSEFAAAIDLILNVRGAVVITGMGKAGLIGRKIAATLASTGTASHFVHPGEALHGDLGMFNSDDLVLALSHSGETDEVVRILPSLTQREIPIIAMTGQPKSALARSAICVLSIGKIQECI